MKKVRFPPSPTGLLHIGNARVALVNFLFARKYDAHYAMRFDDTDTLRCKDEYKTQMLKDLAWLGIAFDSQPIYQSQRSDVYNVALQQLVKIGRVYECFESKDELEVKRKVQTSRGIPIIYDRAALKITADERLKFLADGHIPYYRFLIKDEQITWDDGIQGKIIFNSKDITDPIITRTDGSFMYAFCSIVDDYITSVTDIIRGADHITNTAGQKQMYDALNEAFETNKQIKFWHLPLFQAKEGKISKRVGGFGISELEQNGMEKKAILNFLASIGRSTFSAEIRHLEQLIAEFDIHDFSKSEVIYDPTVLENFNLKCLASYEFDEVKNRLNPLITKDFFNDFKYNITKLTEINRWFDVTREKHFYTDILEENDRSFFNKFMDIISIEDQQDWSKKWDNAITILKRDFPDRKGKEFFRPLRIGFSGIEHGVDLKTFVKWKLRQRGNSEFV